jgi:pimeloyl-ACP methyl ester carboxylesterase
MAYSRIPYLVVFDESAAFKDTYAGEIGRIALEAQLLKPDTPSDTVVVMMHPIGGGAYLPLPGALARAGVHVIVCSSRYRGTDVALIMEKVMLDLGACVRDAKARLGYARVVLGGWSGGGGLSLAYQAEAEDPRITATPAGDPPDLSAAGLIPADGVMLLAAHLSRNRTLTEWLDPSILDESRPFEREPSLNLYAADGPKPPYSPAFLAGFRAAQEARNRRITAWVESELAALRAAGKPHAERGFVVHGTLADPRFLDASLEPSDRRPNWCFLGDPETVNDGPVGLARFSTLRSWLSQWSLDRSQADGLRCAPRVTVPMLVIENSADDACTPGHAAQLMAAATSVRSLSHHVVRGANHYYFGQPDHATNAAAVVKDWLATH